VPPAVSPTTIARSLQVIVPFLAVKGADHMPGIALLEWPTQDLQTAAIDYIQSRRSFASVSDKPADLTLTVKAWLTMRSHDKYHYRVRLESVLGSSEKPAIKSYLVEKETAGSSVRWVTASDQTPIADAVQAALDDLLTQIEADHLLYRK
jgi:hypothetical protein